MVDKCGASMFNKKLAIAEAPQNTDAWHTASLSSSDIYITISYLYGSFTAYSQLS